MARTVENRTDEEDDRTAGKADGRQKASLLCYLQWSMSSQLF